MYDMTTWVWVIVLLASHAYAISVGFFFVVMSMGHTGSLLNLVLQSLIWPYHAIRKDL